MPPPVVDSTGVLMRKMPSATSSMRVSLEACAAIIALLDRMALIRGQDHYYMRFARIPTRFARIPAVLKRSKKRQRLRPASEVDFISMEESRPSAAPGIALICYSLAFSLVKTCSPNGGRLSASPCLSALSRWLLLET